MVQLEFTVPNKTGIHARPASLLVKTLNAYQSDVMIEKQGKCANAKSIIGLMSIAAVQNENITLKIDGPDEQAVSDAVKDLFDRHFDEKE